MLRSAGARLLSALVLAGIVAGQATTPTWAWTTRYGHVGAADRTLRPGCHRYRYHYVVKPPTGDWILETWLYDPRGKPRGSGDFAPGSDPERGHSHFGICRSTVVPGRFTITARLSWYTPGMLPTDPPVHHKRWFQPAHFRLHR
jgi:hypothetical protein